MTNDEWGSRQCVYLLPRLQAGWRCSSGAFHSVPLPRAPALAADATGAGDASAGVARASAATKSRRKVSWRRQTASVAWSCGTMQVTEISEVETIRQGIAASARVAKRRAA